MSPFIAEYMGTLLLLLIGISVVANVVLKGTKGNGSGWMVITTGWGLGVFLGVVVAGPYSGAHLNPAVTVGLAIAGSFKWQWVWPYILAQMLGAMTGALLTWMMYKDHFNQTPDRVVKLGVFATIPAIRNGLRNLLSEIVATFVLVFVIFYLSSGEIKSPDAHTPIGLGSVGAIPVGFLVWAIGLALGGTTGYAINPARDLGPRIFHALAPIKDKGSSDWGYAWIPVFGPLIGGSLAAGLYLILK